jgi:hypothetical protein
MTTFSASYLSISVDRVAEMECNPSPQHAEPVLDHAVAGAALLTVDCTRAVRRIIS